ncbi:MAG: putative outer protein [Herbaspirillum sp.]|nr:putative outer protein [Herbaspirillum sp.]
MTMSINAPIAAGQFATQVQAMAPTAEAMLGKGAEELSFGITATRQPGRRSVSRFTAQPRQNKISQVLALLEAGATSGARFTRLQRLSKAAQSATEDIETFLKGNGLSPEDSMLLLQQILNDMDAQGDHSSTLRQSVMAAQQALDEDMGLEIRARLHALEIALQENMDSAQTSNFQDGYLALILTSGNCAAALDELLRRFHRQLRRALALLVRTLGREIDSQWSCCEPDYLQLLRQALYEVGGIANTYDDCETLTARWREKDALLLNDAVQLTRDLVRLAAEPWAIGTKFITLANRYSTTRQRLPFIGRLRNVVHAMPDLLFFDEAAQQRVYEAVQQALDDEANNESL